MELVEGLVDTGATGTGIRPDIVERLCLEQRGKRRVLTANGDMLVPEYLVRIGFHVGEFSGQAEASESNFPHILDAELLVHSLRPIFPYGMLIGMDVLASCDLTIARDNRVILCVP